MLFLTYDHFPRAHFPLLDQAVDHIRIFAGEVFYFAFVIHAKNQECAVDRIVEGTGENQLSASADLASHVQMHFAEFGAPRDIVVHGFVDQGIIIHEIPPYSKAKGKRRLSICFCRCKIFAWNSGSYFAAALALTALWGRVERGL